MKKCNLCNGTGLYKHDRHTKTGVRYPTPYCDCPEGEVARTARDAEVALKEKIAMKKEKTEASLKRCNIAKRFADIAIADIDNPSVKKLAVGYFEEWETRGAKKGEGLYFWGNVGSGKTFCGLAIVNELRRKKYVEMLFFNFAELMYRIRKGYEVDGKFDPNLLEAVKKCEVLMIDDIGLEKATDWITEQLYLVINSRYEAMLPTIVTSNQSPEDLGKTHNAQIASRLLEMSKVVKFTGKDRRSSKHVTK